MRMSRRCLEVQKPLSLLRLLQWFWKDICASICILYTQDTLRNLSKSPVAAALVKTASGTSNMQIQNPNIFYTAQYYSSLEITRGDSREDMMPYVAVLNVCALS